MRRESKIILVTLALGGAWAVGSRGPGWLDGVDAFRVRDIDVRGARHLGPDHIREMMAVPAEATIWSDRGPWLERISRHAMVADVRIGRRLPGTLIVEVREREPVALVPTPVLEAVDAEGVVLPIDPSTTRLDLPVIAPTVAVAPRARLVPAETRRLIQEVVRLMEGDTAFLQRVSEVSRRPDGTLVARWGEPRVDFLMRPGTPAHRIRDGLLSLEHAIARDPEHRPDVVDLRFDDQVVVRRQE